MGTYVSLRYMVRPSRGLESTNEWLAGTGGGAVAHSETQLRTFHQGSAQWGLKYGSTAWLINLNSI